MKSNTRGMALLAVVAMLATACGSRLTEDEIAVYAGQRGGSGAVAGSVVQDQGDAGSGSGTTDTTTGAAGGTDTSTAAGGTGDGQSGARAPGQAGSGEAAAQGPAEQGGDGTGQPPADDAGDGAGADDGPDAEGDPSGDGAGQPERAPADTRAAPPGGNGGATDVGVTAEKITIYNVADLTGAVPGLFQDAKEATQAYFAFFQATEGTVYGRQIEFVSRDTGLSSNGNRSAYLDACDGAFAAVGSMSAFEEGAADPISSCGIPDLRNIPTSKALQELPNSMGADATRPGEVPLSEWTYYKETFPEAISQAAYVLLENTTTIYQTTQNRKATERIGYQWLADIRISTSETNYARVVNELKSKDVQFVAFQGAYQQAVRLVDAMHQQGYAPKALALQSNIYTPDLISTCGEKCEEYVSVAQTGALIEEIDSNPELQTYAEWLARVNPRARPTGLGMYSWSAAKLFVESLKAIGPEPTRAKLLEHLSTITAYDGGGLVPPQNISTQQPTDCIIMLDIQDGQFVRIESGGGYRCRDAPGKV